MTILTVLTAFNTLLLVGVLWTLGRRDGPPEPPQMPPDPFAQDMAKIMGYTGNDDGK